MSADATQAGAEILLRALKEQGVEVIFGYPGGAVLPIYDAIFNQNAVRHILVRQEGGAVHAAEGYARSTGKVGVVLVTSGPGATNAVTGLCDALMDSIPVVCLTGQVPTIRTAPGTGLFPVVFRVRPGTDFAVSPGDVLLHVPGGRRTPAWRVVLRRLPWREGGCWTWRCQ